MSHAFTSSRARIERICAGDLDARSLRREVIDELRRVVGFDAYAWLLTDPATAVGSAPVADVPWMRELPRQIRLKYCSSVNRWTALGDTPVAFLHDATAGDLAQSLVWRDLLVDYGVHDAASLVFADRFGCWAFLELWRSDTPGRFGPAQAAFLGGLIDPLTLALRRCQARAFTASSTREQARAGPVVLVLSFDLQVRSQTPQAMAYLQTLVPAAEGRAPVPAVAYNVGAQLLAVEDGIDSNPPTARVHVSNGLWMTARAGRFDEPGTAHTGDIVVTLEESSGAERLDVFCRAVGLSERERELLEHLAAGEGTREVAAGMFVSQNTVQDHLKSIFAKSGVRSRRALLSRALGS